ncbi:MAG TPA: zf-HC2 domain-containing protein [Candidatus Methylomirabilis sp.]|jgi:anti-sigma factor RsiW|nr:zf-HC2 domain-containing protein [Candidatus Methylomirabilis sp.]
MMHLLASRRLSAYLDGELAPGERLAVERHLGRCPRCAARLQDLGRLRGALRSLPRSVPAEDGWTRLREEIGGAAPERARLRWRPATARRWAPVAATAALLAALGASLYLTSAPGPPRESLASLTTTHLIEEEPLPLSPSIELVLVARGSGGADRGEEP